MSFETWNFFFFGLNREAPYTFNFFWYSWFPDISCTDKSGFCRLFSPCLSSMGAIGPNLEFDLEWPPSWYVFPIRPVWRITFPKFEPSWSKLKFDTTFDLLLDLFFQLTPCGGSLSPRLRPIGASWNLMRPLTPIDLQCDTKNLISRGENQKDVTQRLPCVRLTVVTMVDWTNYNQLMHAMAATWVTSFWLSTLDILRQIWNWVQLNCAGPQNKIYKKSDIGKI